MASLISESLIGVLAGIGGGLTPLIVALDSAKG